VSVSFDWISLLAGASITLIVTVLGFFFTQILLFQTKVIFPKRFNQTNYRYERLFEDYKGISSSILVTYIKIEGYKPAKDIKIYFDGDLYQLSFYPNLPFELDYKKKLAKINVIQKGIYKIEAVNLQNDKYAREIRIVSVESSNAKIVERDLIVPKFEPLMSMPSIILLICASAFAIIQLLELISKLD
jgi:hypothetical protein